MRNDASYILTIRSVPWNLRAHPRTSRGKKKNLGYSYVDLSHDRAPRWGVVRRRARRY